MSIREDIINNIESTLAGITVAGGYNNNIGVVTRESERFEHYSTSEYPIALIVWDSETKEGMDAAYNTVESDLVIIIRGAVYATSAIETALNNFIEDIEKVLAVDTTRNNKAEFTAPMAIEVHLGDREHTLVFDFVFMIRYYYVYGNP